MKRQLKLTVDIILQFDDDIDDATAIDTFLQSNVREVADGITVYDARVTHGLVDQDGVPCSP